jgi:hypothetical protein
MPALRTYNVFISHAWAYRDDYHRLLALLNAAPNFQWANYSVPDHDPLAGGSAAKLRPELNNQMRFAQVVLAMSGVYASHSDWMQEEFNIAAGFGRPIIGVYFHASQRASSIVQRNAVEMVNWSTVSIVDAVRRHGGW